MLINGWHFQFWENELVHFRKNVSSHASQADARPDICHACGAVYAPGQASIFAQGALRSQGCLRGTLNRSRMSISVVILRLPPRPSSGHPRGHLG